MSNGTEQSPVNAVEAQRQATLDAIDRRRSEIEESGRPLPRREVLAGATQVALREFASALRARTWDDRTVSAEESGEPIDDPGWAPSPGVRIAALLDHLSELALPIGNALPESATRPGVDAGPLPELGQATWTRVPVEDLGEQLGTLPGEGNVLLFNGESGKALARATSWRGEIVEVFFALPDQEPKRSRKGGADEGIEGWGEALVRAGYARPHFGPDLTAEIFTQYVAGHRRLDVTPDVNALTHGLVHHLARVVPQVDFTRAAITDLEIQRLAEQPDRRQQWRMACRILERFPVNGPAWRALGRTDATALLLARAEQRGAKAPGADALLAHEFEEYLPRAMGIRPVLLTADNGLARTVAARLPGSVWVGYVDPPSERCRFFSPILSWPDGSVVTSRYSSLSALVDEMLVCSVANWIVATDRATTYEFRAHIQGEHQYPADWVNPYLYVRKSSVAHSPHARPSTAWPLVQFAVGDARPCAARVTLSQVAAVLNWLRQTSSVGLKRGDLPFQGEAKDEVWRFLIAVDLVDDSGEFIGRQKLNAALTAGATDELRAIILRFAPLKALLDSIRRGNELLADVRTASGLGERAFGSALKLAIGAGLVWRNADRLGLGDRYVDREAFLSWLFATLAGSTRVAELATLAAQDLQLSPPRFREALKAVIGDTRLAGTRGGSVETQGLDCEALVLTAAGTVELEQLQIDGLLGLRTLERRE